MDVRNASAALLDCDIVLDCSDDPNLTPALTGLSNGLRRLYMLSPLSSFLHNPNA